MINNINESINSLRYCIFDWDDNILHMETPIHFQHKENGKWVEIDVSTSEYARIKNTVPDYINGEEWRIDFDRAFLDFRDFGPRGKNAFLGDVIKSLDNKDYGPSWNNFINCLISGNLFSIVTTRGHEPETIKNVVRYIIYHELNDFQQNLMLKNLMIYHEFFSKDFDYLIDDYLNNCFFIGITSQYFIDKFGYDPSSNPSKGKKDSIQFIINRFNQYSKQSKLPTKIGFSDDDISYVNTIKNLFIRNKEVLDNIDFYLYNTHDPKNIITHKMKYMKNYFNFKIR
jgi:hypothetical protein